jgi:hypothetical protein
MELELGLPEAPGAHNPKGRALGVVAPPELVAPGWPPSGSSLRQYFLYIPKIIFVNFHPIRELIFLHKNNTMAILLKTASVRVSSFQIMQIRVQNKSKSVWKSRYIRDVSMTFKFLFPPRRRRPGGHPSPVPKTPPESSSMGTENPAVVLLLPRARLARLSRVHGRCTRSTNVSIINSSSFG